MSAASSYLLVVIGDNKHELNFVRGKLRRSLSSRAIRLTFPSKMAIAVWRIVLKTIRPAIRLSFCERERKRERERDRREKEGDALGVKFAKVDLEEGK
jgi:hypothetical protein